MSKRAFMDPDRRGQVVIRPWDDDTTAVEALVTAIWDGDPVWELIAGRHGSNCDQPMGFRRTLCAVEAAGGVVGVGTLWQNGLHPNAWHLTIHVTAPWRRRGRGSTLLQNLTGLAPAEKPWRAATRATDHAGRAFLARHGFKQVMQTRCGVFTATDLAAVLRRELAEATERVLAVGYQLLSLPEALGRGVTMADVARLHVEVYWAAHAWSRPRPVTEAEAADIFLAPGDLLPDAMHLVVDGQRVLAVASLRQTDSPGEVELGWAGSGLDVADPSADLRAAVLGRCLEQAAAARWRVRFEADAGDDWWWRMMNRMPAQPEPDWLTFQDQNPKR